jgi:divalent metal cation (Fe/Co/Zn/Cd) transporter
MRTPDQSHRQWLAGLAITLTALVCLFGFWRLSPIATMIIAAIALVALIFVFWLAGRPSDRQ